MPYRILVADEDVVKAVREWADENGISLNGIDIIESEKIDIRDSPSVEMVNTDGAVVSATGSPLPRAFPPPNTTTPSPEYVVSYGGEHDDYERMKRERKKRERLLAEAFYEHQQRMNAVLLSAAATNVRISAVSGGDDVNVIAQGTPDRVTGGIVNFLDRQRRKLINAF